MSTYTQCLGLVGVLLVMGCGGGAAARPAGKPTTVAGMASLGDEALVAEEWGVGLVYDPAVAVTEVNEEMLRVDTIARGDLQAGVFELTVRRASAPAKAGSLAYVTAVREQAAKDGGRDQFSEVTPVRFLGRGGHAVTFVDSRRQASGLWLAMMHGPCVFELVVMRSGPPQWMTEYASLVLRNIKSLSGKPVAPVRCK